jgi:hypothetical protein
MTQQQHLTIRAWHVLEHLVNVERALAELWRVCAAGARVEFRVPHWQHPSTWDTLDHKRAYTPGVFLNLDRGVVHPATAFAIRFRFRALDVSVVNDEATGAPKDIRALLEAVKP